MGQEGNTVKPGRGARQGPVRLLSVTMAILMVSLCFSVPFSEDAQALDFVETLPVPWSSSFTPLDSAWDANGTQCVVVGNETNGKSPSAYLYNDPSGTWFPIHEGTDPGAKVNRHVENYDTGMVYPNIQQAINNASAGDTIIIWSGTYNETLTIGKPLTLQGNGSANTIINGRNLGTVIRVTGNGVNISGLKMTGGPSYSGILLYKNQNCRVENCTVEGNGDGICICGSSNNILKNNYVQNNAGTGIKTQDSETTKSLVGLTNGGGDSNSGAMFKMDQSGTNYSLIHNFNYGYTDGYGPYYTKFIQDIFDGNILYGMTQQGGKFDGGTIFRMDKSGSGYVLLHEFRTNSNMEGCYPLAGLTQFGSVLYGTTNNGGLNYYGTIFRINTDGTGFSTIFNFTYAGGSYPRSSLTLVGTMLYGTASAGGTNNYGTIFRINVNGTGYIPMIHFNRYNYPYGNSPYGSLALDTNTGTTLYGMTYFGGSNSYNAGVVYKVNTDGNGYKCLLNFTGTTAPLPSPPNPLQGYGRNPSGTLLQSGSTLYGMTYSGGSSAADGNVGALFRVSTDGTSYKCLYNFTTTIAVNGYYPYGSLVQDANNLYGMTSTGGSGYGTVFSFGKVSSIYTPIHTFNSLPDDGQTPHGTLLYDGSTLYGMTQYGGVFQAGTAFMMNPSGSFYQKLHDFDDTPTNGLYAAGSPVQSGQYLYGATQSGGMHNQGCIFRTDLNGNNFILLHNFYNGLGEGYEPYSSPIVSGGFLYGTTTYGGYDDNGVLYRMSIDGSGYTNLHEFASDGTDGYYPESAPVLVGSTLYGTTNGGGSSYCGIIYSIETAGTNYQVLYTLSGYPLSGSYPRGGLVTDGINLFGMTYGGGVNDYGCIFNAACDGSSFTILHSFSSSSSDGAYPYGTPVLDGNMLYGTTSDGGANYYGSIFSLDITTSNFNLLRSLTSADGSYPQGSLTMDGTMLYGMANGNGAFGDGTIFRINKNTMAFTVLHNLAGQPNDGAYPYLNDVAIINHPAQSSSNNLIFHNNIIGNAIQALNDDPPSNYWCDVYPVGGNYWSDYTGVDNIPAGGGDGIGDTGYSIPDIPLCMDSYPFMIRDGWAMPYTTFKSVAWDSVYHRFWICGEVSSDAKSVFYYIPATAPTTMVPIMAPPIPFTALATDEVGGVLIGTNDQMAIFYYSVARNNGYSIVENGTGGMYGWNITGMTFNPYDNRFYVVGTVKNMDVGVAFVTDPLPLNQSGRKCYIDTSDFMNSPGIKGLKSISWNPSRNYSIAVGDGVYRLSSYNGNPSHSLTWATIESPQAGTSYYDISWDRNGWNEAGIVGRNGSYAKYWRYYHTNQNLIDGNTSAVSGTRYTTCAMKPPSSPKWLMIPASVDSIRVNIQEKDESGTVSFSANKPQIFSVKVWKQTDLLQVNLLNNQVDADSTYTFFVEGNYTVGGIDMWSSLRINITAWFDNGIVGIGSQPNDPTWNNSNSRTRQFKLTYNAMLNFASLVYPAQIFPGAPREFFIASYWRDPMPHGSDGYTHRVLINVTFKQQTWAADGTGFGNGPAAGGAIWDKALALNDANSWDMQVYMYDAGNVSMFNTTYEEFGIKEFASISSMGSPTGSAPPGEIGLYLGNCTLHLSSNVAYFVTVSIPDLHMNGEPTNPKFIPTNSLYVQNTHNYSDPAYSEMDSQVYFSGPNQPICVWGIGNPIPTPIATPWHGTETAGPMYTDYQAAAMSQPFELTKFSWWIDVPVSVSAGVYVGTITITISDTL